jgi:hypothetical protein
MAKITRFTGNLRAFAADALANERTIFGDVVESDDLDDNINANYLRGWGIVPASGFPTREDFNGAMFTAAQLVSYLHQVGVPEWDSAQEYFEHSRVIGSDGRLYRALTGDDITPNVGNDPVGDAVNWNDELGDFVELAGNQSIDGVKTFTESPVVPTPTTDFQTAPKGYVDGLLVAATQTTSGLIKIASEAESRGWADNTKAITPLRLATALGGANQSLTESGYQKIPGGLIFQWGLTTAYGTVDNEVKTVTFPVAFTAAVFAVITVATNTSVSGSNSSATVQGTPTLTQAVLMNDNPTGSTVITGTVIKYIAVGV